MPSTAKGSSKQVASGGDGIPLINDGRVIFRKDENAVVMKYDG